MKNPLISFLFGFLINIVVQIETCDLSKQLLSSGPGLPQLASLNEMRSYCGPPPNLPCSSTNSRYRTQDAINQV